MIIIIHFNSGTRPIKDQQAEDKKREKTAQADTEK